nr:unnamed protein product [Haemonchus contortus]
MLRLLRLLVIATLLAVFTANAASIKSMIDSQMMQKREARDKNFLTYIGNVPEHIGVMMMRARLLRQ